MSLIAMPLLVAAQAAPIPEFAEPQPHEARQDLHEQLLLLSVQLDNVTLSEAMVAYGDSEDPLVPIGELTRLLELPVEVNPGAGLVTGRIGENERSLTIDIASGRALVGTRAVPLLPPDHKVTQTDIFFRASLIEKLLPILIKASPDDMAIAVTAREKLPIQARRERASRLTGLNFLAESPVSVLKVETPYRWLGDPAFDIAVELGADSARNRPVTRLEGRAAADLLQMGFNGYVSTNERGELSTARVIAERRSHKGGLLGPLGGTYAAAGDVYSPALALGPRSLGGAGAVFSNQRVDETSAFERINLRGELPIGYDVELYVNDVLRAGGQGNATAGRYEFTDVPLVRGRNVVRIVLYGPRGERSERTRIINVGGGQLPAGRTVIEAGVLAQNRPVIRLSNDDTFPDEEDTGSLRAVINLAHGLTSILTASAGFATYSDLSGQRHEVLTGGLSTSLFGMALQGDYAKDFKGGDAASLGAAGRVAGIDFIARHVEYFGAFADEANPLWDANRNLARFDELTFDFNFAPTDGLRLPLSGRVERAEYVDGATLFGTRGRTAVSVADTLVAIGADYQRRTEADGNSTQLTGHVAASRFINYKWRLRANADYEVEPNLSLRALGATADRSIGERYNLRFGATQSFGESRDFALSAGLSARLPFAEATLGGNYSTNQDRWRFGLQLNFGLAFDSLAGRYRATPPGPANGGSAAFQAFIDSNANGLRESDEESVPGVVIQGGSMPTATDENGRAFLTGLGNGPLATLLADTTNTDTVFVSTPPSSIALTPRAGSVARINYPMVPTTEVFVRLNFRKKDGSMAGLAAVRVKLVSEDGTTFEGMSEYDGIIVFDSVTPGRYELQLDSEQAQRLGMQLINTIKVLAKPDGGAVRAEGEVILTERS